MTASLSALVVDYTHALGAEMQSAQRRRRLMDQLAATTFLLVDIAGAEEVGRGSRIFPEPDAPLVDWYVLTNRMIDDHSETALFSWVGVIPGDAEPDEVVAQAYLQVLRRPVDAAGYENYRTRLASGDITRRGLLKSLASSGEAREKGVSVLILPETSLLLPRRDEDS